MKGFIKYSGFQQKEIVKYNYYSFKGAFDMNDLDKMMIMRKLAELAKMLEDQTVTKEQYLKEKEKLMEMLRKFNPSI